MSIFPLLIIFGVAGISYCVDRGNFKTCDQSGFCKRQRNYKPDISPYKANLQSLQVSSDEINVEVTNTRSGVTFLATIITLHHNTARLQIKELNPIKARYEPPVGDVLISDPQRDRLEVTSRTDTSLTLAWNGNKVFLQLEPFRLDFIVDGDPVIGINSNGLLKFEHTRVKDEAAESVENSENEEEEAHVEDPQEDTKEDDTDAWEETFKSHKDTKPHGPQSVGMDISFPGVEHVYGIPEHADSVALRSTRNTDPYRLYNLDVFEYELNNPMALYGSVPVMYAHNEKRTVGMFWLNVAETWIDVHSNVADKSTFSKLAGLITGDNEMPQIDTHWFSESGIIDVFFMLGPTPQDVFLQYAKLTGTTPLPPLFALAYHQSRWNYNNEQDVAGVDANFDEHDIPCDVIWLDIEHTDGKRYFTWDMQKFPHPQEMINNVSAKGRKMVTIVDPHLKSDSGYRVFQEGKSQGFLVKNKDGNDYDGWCWPGSSGWLDFLDPKIRDYWAKQFNVDEYSGSTLDLYTWNDMNEPSVFNGPEITMHKDAIHYGGWEHRDVHNIYGLYVHRATYEGHLQRSDNQRRPFVLSRSFYAGSQNYGAVWTGDNTGEWSHLKASLPMILSMSLVGITFSGADVGGFFKNPDTELLTRWYQAGAYQPFFRAHAHLDTKRREPWLLPEENKLIIREAIRQRYALLPYWYTLFFQSEQSGAPTMKPLWVDFPKEKECFAIEDEYLIGSGLLVHPVTDAASTGVTVYFPGKHTLWYDVNTYQVFNGEKRQHIVVDKETIPVYQRGGSIIPRKERIRRASTLSYNDPYTLTVALDTKGEAVGDVFIDDYDGYRYKDGHYSMRQFTFQNNKLHNRDMKENTTGFQTKSWLEKVTILGFPMKPKNIFISGKGFENRKLEFQYDTEKKTLKIRKPAANINVDWTISIE